MGSYETAQTAGRLFWHYQEITELDLDSDAPTDWLKRQIARCDRDIDAAKLTIAAKLIPHFEQRKAECQALLDARACEVQS